LSLNPPILRVEHLRKRYGQRAVVDDVSFEIGRGEIVALLGANGAGKTTMLKCLLGITSFEGDVSILGRPVKKEGKQARRLIGYVPQLPSMHEDERCEDVLNFAAELRGAPRTGVDGAFEAVNLQAQRRFRVGELSGGMRQRLAMAAALLGEPQLLLLDEPTASLDAESRGEFELILMRLRDAGKTILLSTHMLDRTEGLVSRALVLRHGSLGFDGTFADLIARTGGSRYVVNLDGQSLATFLQAMRELGVAGEAIAAAPATWEEILRAVATSESEQP
jgi:ABC-type multidrug transport system ATPase subunit